MTIDVTAGQTANLSDRVAEEIRALLGRRRMSQAELARKLGTSGAWLNYRLTGKQPIDLNDLADIAGALGVAVADLLPQHVTTRQYLSRGKDRPQAAGHRPPNMPGSRRPQRRNLDRIAA